MTVLQLRTQGGSGDRNKVLPCDSKSRLITGASNLFLRENPPKLLKVLTSSAIVTLSGQVAVWVCRRWLRTDLRGQRRRKNGDNIKW